jgi:pSer/pThr/pTyr-binding forkhead associated (FHA) protein
VIEGEESFTVGRVVENQLSIPDFGISRRHFLIKREGENLKIEDLKSHNGTFVNGIPVQELQLKHEDRIRVGRTELLFLTDDNNEMTFYNQLQFDEGNLITHSEVRLSIEKAETDLPQDLI